MYRENALRNCHMCLIFWQMFAKAGADGQNG